MSQETYVYVSYLRTPDIEFDTDYYINEHMALVDKHWKNFGLKSWTIVQFPEGDPCGMHTQAILRWDSADGFDRAFAANIPEIMQDVPNFSNTYPVRWFGNVVKEG